MFLIRSLGAGLAPIAALLIAMPAAADDSQERLATPGVPALGNPLRKVNKKSRRSLGRLARPRRSAAKRRAAKSGSLIVKQGGVKKSDRSHSKIHRSGSSP